MTKEFNKENIIEYVPKKQAIRSGYFLVIPMFDCYGVLPKRISNFLFSVFSFFPFFATNPFNGYLVLKNNRFRQAYMTDYIYNPWEKVNISLAEKFGFEWERNKRIS